MNQETLEKLNTICADFKSFRANTVDGQGKSLHDIKNTFDYVAKTVETYKLTGTAFGENLSEKAKAASQVLSQLWTCLNDLEKAISNFTESQSKSNNQIGDNFGTTLAEKFDNVKKYSESASELGVKASEAGLAAQAAAKRVQEAMQNFDASAIENLKNVDFSGLQNL